MLYFNLSLASFYLFSEKVEISNRDRVSEEMALALEDTRLSRDKLREECKEMVGDLTNIKLRLRETEENLNTVTQGLYFSECFLSAHL